MDFGVVLQTDPPARRVVGFARKAEALGFTHAYTFDSHVLWQEPYVIHSAMLAATSTLTVGPMVTNPGTRDWTVTASVFATLNEMYGERTVCGIGRGDSAMRVIGYPSCNLATLEEAMDVIKGLAEGGEVDYNGTRQTFPWCEGGSLPMWMAAYGPKALALCGRKADGFILQLADPQIAAWTIGAVRRAAEEAGRDPDSITICVVAPAYVGDDIAHQRDQVRWFGGMVGNHVADLVGRYGTARSESAGLDFDASTGRLLIFHGSVFNDLEVSLLSSVPGGNQPRLETEYIWDYPGDLNSEGVAVAPVDTCSGGARSSCSACCAWKPRARYRRSAACPCHGFRTARCCPRASSRRRSVTRCSW